MNLATPAFLRLIRSGNLAMMAFTQLLVFYCLSDYHLLEDLFNVRLFFLIFSTSLAAAAGYIINDYHDVKTDLVNKPEKVVIGNLISRRQSMAYYLLMNLVALAFASVLGSHVAVAVTLCIISLWLYSTRYKKRFLTGNMLVAALSAFVIIVVRIFDPTLPFFPVFCYATFAFMISLIREMIKDAEDISGDEKTNSHTLPLVLGIRKTKRVLLYLTIAFILFLMTFLMSATDSMSFEHPSYHKGYTIYMIVLVLLPLTTFCRQLIKADTKKDFTRLSLFCKGIMVAGMLSMVFFRL